MLRSNAYMMFFVCLFAVCSLLTPHGFLYEELNSFQAFTVMLHVTACSRFMSEDPQNILYVQTCRCTYVCVCLCMCVCGYAWNGGGGIKACRSGVREALFA